MRILIVEDEEALAKVLVEKLKSNSFTCETASDGIKALESLKKFKPDVVLLDLMLPIKGGMEVLKEMKSDDETKNLPVIVLSNLDSDEDIKEALKLGADDYFVKNNHPINEVIEKVKSLTLLRK